MALFVRLFRLTFAALLFHQARPYASRLPHPGAVSDPDAQWRQWLATV